MISPVLFIFLTWKKKIYADTFLQCFYVLMSVYGFVTWGGAWKKIHWHAETHIWFITAGLIVTFISGYLLKKKTDAQLPYLDSFTTIFAMTGTWMMMNFVHENWLYFITINITSFLIYFRRRLYTGAMMFIVYLIMAIDGYFELNIFTW